MINCKHPSLYRRFLARLRFLDEKHVRKIDSIGILLQKIANTIRFEHFWTSHVTPNKEIKIVASFTKSRSKHPIWNIVIEKLANLGNNGQVLEFGTNNGGSLNYFVSRLPKTMIFHGFDCFEGLPEAWDGVPRGSIRGYGMPIELWPNDPNLRAEVLNEYERTQCMPLPPQPNVHIHSGLFSESLPKYLVGGEVPKDIRLIHFDADLYISTRPILDTLCGQMSYEYYVLFDEFYSANHEFRAWREFVELFKLSKWKVVAISEDGVQVLIQVNPGSDQTKRST